MAFCRYCGIPQSLLPAVAGTRDAAASPSARVHRRQQRSSQRRNRGWQGNSGHGHAAGGGGTVAGTSLSLIGAAVGIGKPLPQEPCGGRPARPHFVNVQTGRPKRCRKQLGRGAASWTFGCRPCSPAVKGLRQERSSWYLARKLLDRMSWRTLIIGRPASLTTHARRDGQIRTTEELDLGRAMRTLGSVPT